MAVDFYGHVHQSDILELMFEIIQKLPDEGQEEVYCPQCGADCEQLHEGHCEPCCEQNQKELDEHNASYDRWQGLSDEQRASEIKLAR